LIHAGAQDQIQICVNIYGRSHGQHRKPIDAPRRLPKRLPTGVSREEAQAFQNWWNRCSSPMPDGIYEIGRDTLRFFEMPETTEFELPEGYKRDDSGWWDVEFDPFVKIDRGDLVILSDEIKRVTNAGEFDTKPVDAPMLKRERDTLLKLVIGMAIKGYSHDPAASKSTAPKEIADDLAALGMAITDDTVRKYLKLASATVLPGKPRQP
jgi:hypothetical protein